MGAVDTHDRGQDSRAQERHVHVFSLSVQRATSCSLERANPLPLLPSSLRIDFYGQKCYQPARLQENRECMNREALSPLRTPALPTGVLTDHELLLGGMVGGKPVLQAHLLPWEARTLEGLLNYLWEQEVTTVWVLPTAKLSHEITATRLEQESGQWITLIHAPSITSERPSSAVFFPRGSRSAVGRRMTLAFPAHAGWNWQLPDALSLLATVTYLEQLLSRQVVDTPQQCAAQVLGERTSREPVSELRASAV